MSQALYDRIGIGYSEYRRMFTGGEGELIFYRRENVQGPKESYYRRSLTTTPKELLDSLSLAYGVAGRVKKRRLLYKVGRTRIHLDAVEGLGYFVELEVVLNDDDSVEAGVAEAYQVMEALGIERRQLIEDAYVDLLGRSDEQKNG